MKRVIQIVAILLVILVPVILSAQPMPYDPLVGGGTGAGPVGGSPPGGGAPIGGGLLILISLAMGYGAKRLYGLRKKVLN